MHRIKRLVLALGLLGAFMVAAAPFAHAITFDLTSDHCTGGCGTAPYGTITVTQNGTTVDVTVHLATGYSFAKTGSADDQAFKFNATGVVLADITVDAHIPGLVASAGAFNGDGTGDFGFGINCPTCGGGGSSAFTNDIVFHVANATIADLTAPNNLGNVFVADVLAPNGNTGPVDATTPNPPTTTTTGTPTTDVPVPEPSSLLLVGAGLVALAQFGRRLNRQN